MVRLHFVLVSWLLLYLIQCIFLSCLWRSQEKSPQKSVLLFAEIRHGLGGGDICRECSKLHPRGLKKHLSELIWQMPLGPRGSTPRDGRWYPHYSTVILHTWNSGTEINLGDLRCGNREWPEQQILPLLKTLLVSSLFAATIARPWVLDGAGDLSDARFLRNYLAIAKQGSGRKRRGAWGNADQNLYIRKKVYLLPLDQVCID